MTLKEKVAEIQPDCIDDNSEVDGVERCPSDYEYLNKPKLYFNSCECKHYTNCCECWNQKFNPELKSITWAKLWRRIGKQPIRKTQNKKVEILIDGELKKCGLVFTDNGQNFHLEMVE